MSEFRTVWQKYWDELASEWIRIETLQDYSGQEGENNSLKLWSEGKKQESLELIRSEALEANSWIKQCQQKTAQGVKLKRLRVVSVPFTTYLEWEMEMYKYVNIPKCNEEIFIVSREEADQKGILLPEGTIFDSNRALINQYDVSGKLIGGSDISNSSGLLFLNGNLEKYLL